MIENKFDYAILKSETTAEIILIIHINNEWLGKEIDFSINKQNIDIVIDKQTFNSGLLPLILLDWLKKNQTKVYFANNEGIIVSETIVGEK